MATQIESPVSDLTAQATYCVFEYLYRDAANYKAWGEILLSGAPTESEMVALRGCLESGEYFVAEQVGIPSVYEELWKLSDGPTEDDHALHEFACIRAATQDDIESMPLFGTCADLLSKFKSVIAWDYTLSPNCAPISQN